MAASEWEDDNARRLVNDSNVAGAASTVFCHPRLTCDFVVRGDDFAFAATELELRKMRSRMCEWYDVKVRGIPGSGGRDVREIEILGRHLRWTEEGLEYEASDKHRQALLEGLGFSAVKSEEIGQAEDEEILEGTEQTRFRSLVATLEYMGLDRSDVQHAAKEMCTKVAKPGHANT